MDSHTRCAKIPGAILLTSAFLLALCPVRTSAQTIVPVYVSPIGSYQEVRIPSLVCTQTGTLLAFAEGRVIPGDHARNDILLRRSMDNGATWGSIQYVHADPDRVFVNPCSVVLPSGRVLLMYQSFPHGLHARKIGDSVKLLSPGLEGDRISRTLLQWSDDDGVTWSTPRDITAQTKRPAPIISTASGPGIGIVIARGPHKGRVVIPTNEGWWETPGRIFNVFACYSDDNGEMWQIGEIAPRSEGVMGDEVQIVECSDGALLLNSRASFGSHRLSARSTDGGENWSPLRVESSLPEPRCMGSIFRYSWPEDGKSRILFANPGNEISRTKGTVRVSYDEGKTWPVSKVVFEGDFAYSCLARLTDHSIGLLYETNDHSRIEFMRFTLEWLEGS
ncbi:MAG: hypothetical protein AMXMBFR84_28970 [Candidatus Hydrogenedentota bacterium]